MKSEDSSGESDDLQFDEAESSEADVRPGACESWEKPIVGSYFEAGGQVVYT